MASRVRTVVVAAEPRGILMRPRCVTHVRMDCVMADPQDWYPETDEDFSESVEEQEHRMREWNGAAS